MNGIVIGLAGRIGSGKSTIATCVARVLGCSSVSFGDYVRLYATQNEYNTHRQTLQNLGQGLLTSSGADEFSRQVLLTAKPGFTPGRDLVVDGIRHVEVARSVARLVRPSTFALVFLEVDERVRRDRLRVREVEEDSDRQRLEDHPTERDVRGLLPAQADLRLISTRPSAEVAGALLSWIRGHRAVTCQSEAAS
jgi:cytidylate kinase